MLQEENIDERLLILGMLSTIYSYIQSQSVVFWHRIGHSSTGSRWVSHQWKMIELIYDAFSIVSMSDLKEVGGQTSFPAVLSVDAGEGLAPPDKGGGKG